MSGAARASQPGSAPATDPTTAESYWKQHQASLSAVGLAALLIVGAVWLLALRVRVSKQTRQIRAQYAQERLLDARYRDLFETAGDAVWVTDRDNLIVALNQAAEELLKTTRDRAIGLPIATFISPDETDLTRASRVRNKDEPFELELMPETGPRVIAEVTSRLLPNGGVQTVARNVTERKKLQARAQQQQTLEALGRMAGGIAHDFNNLLTVINASAATLVDQLPAGEPSRTLAGEILGAGTRAANLTRRLLSFSRPRLNATAPLDLARAVSDSAGLLRRLAGAEVKFEVELAPDTPWVRGDVGLIEQILMNLCVNAKDAMPGGGTLTLRTGRGPTGAAVLTVADTGVGMSPEVQARVFEPFFTTKEVGKGTGLGLATVYAAVQALGGQIRLYSDVGRGTAFSIEFPAVPAPNEDTVPLMPVAVGVSDPTPKPEQSWGVGKTVLLVEDDEAILEIARSGLAGHGFHVEASTQGAEALALAERLGGQVQLLVTDLMMPGMTGVELAQRVLAMQPALRVLFMSGYDADEVDTSALPAGTWSFLRKPFHHPSDVGTAARDLLRGVPRRPAVQTSEA
jgi:PAS domain S-box-containing protein